MQFDKIGDVKAEEETIQGSCIYRIDEESEPPKPRTIVKHEEDTGDAPEPKRVKLDHTGGAVEDQVCDSS